jgi:uncharacterized RDD family membrane protein YckC
MQWYYEGSKKSIGPISEEDFQALIKNGTINNSTLVWNATMTDWKRYGELNGSSAQSAGGTISICAECGVSYLREDMIKYGDNWVCAQCKPVFIQKIKEGVTVKQMDYAGFWIRFGANIIDSIISGVVNVLISIGFGVLAAVASSSSDPSNAAIYSIIAFLLSVVIGIGYETFFIGKWGATIGKMACGIKVVTPEGEKITYLRAFARLFAKGVSAIFLMIGYIMAAFDDEKRALHDRICSTRVIKK